MMSPIECHHERMCELPEGPVLAISFRGVYPPGSLGNEHAREMYDYVAEVMTEMRPVAVLFDLTSLDYVWGDAIATIIIALRTETKTFPPPRIVANGPTGQALGTLLTTTHILQATGGDLFESREDGLAYLLMQRKMRGA